LAAIERKLPQKKVKALIRKLHRQAILLEDCGQEAAIEALKAAADALEGLYPDPDDTRS
jgi:hypothetical protein